MKIIGFAFVSLIWALLSLTLKAEPLKIQLAQSSTIPPQPPPLIFPPQPPPLISPRLAIIVCAGVGSVAATTCNYFNTYQ